MPRLSQPSRPEPSAPAQHGELAFIERIRRAASSGRTNPAIRLGIGDDAAILRPKPGEELIVTTDFSLEGRHFTRDRHAPQSIGHRTLARGLSDIAAMGARPLAAFLSLALPKSLARDPAWLDAFLEGFISLAHTARVSLAGGDTSESPSDHILADITLLGATPYGTALRRSTARPGDHLYCTGWLGGAAAELDATLNHSGATHPTASASVSPNPHPHFFPTPRLTLGQQLRQRKLASAAMDLSDGLSTDLTHLCHASRVAAEIELARLPLHPLAAARTHEQALDFALNGGEDYELLFTTKPRTKLPRTLAGIPLTRIGTILAPRRNQPTLTQVAADGTRSPLEPHGWEHLR
jgi:thiamine-monophosphate kinase